MHFLATCDCFVSLHRAEGLGLPMLEAITFARPVIATAYSGNMQFMDGESSYLVPYELVPIPEGEWGFSAGATWAEPDVAAAASHLRRVYEKQDEARPEPSLHGGSSSLSPRWTRPHGFLPMSSRTPAGRGCLQATRPSAAENVWPWSCACGKGARSLGLHPGRSRHHWTTARATSQALGRCQLTYGCERPTPRASRSSIRREVAS
jgi:hypothetical protein